MLNNFSKILEKIIKNRLINYLEKYKLLSKNQYGFRPGLGTVNALYSATSHIYNALDHGEKTLAVFLDLAKAFDMVNHEELIKTLPSFGIKTTSLNWFRNYLKDRQQIVKINKTLGQKRKIMCGVPQGSVFGPLFFILYINCICNINIDGKIVTYADDTCLLFTDSSWLSVQLKAISELKKVVNLFNSKKLSLNIKKTYFMTFSIYNSVIPFQELTVHCCKNIAECNDDMCKKISRVQSTRYLGITFDSNFKWNLHINNIVMRLRSSLYKFYKLKNILPVNILRNIYLALYQSVFQYGCLVWGGLSEIYLKPLQLQQNKIIRICLDAKTMVGSTNQNYKEFKVLPVRSVYKKIVIFWLDTNRNTWFNTELYKNKRQHRALDALVKYVKTTCGQKFIDYLGPTTFNSLDYDIKQKLLYYKNKNQKKKLINEWLLCNLP